MLKSPFSYNQRGCRPAALVFSWHSLASHRMFLLLISRIVTGMSALKNAEFGNVCVFICTGCARVLDKDRSELIKICSSADEKEHESVVTDLFIYRFP